MKLSALQAIVAGQVPADSGRAYALAAAAVFAVAGLGAPLLGHLDLANIAMLFPLAVLFAAVRLGRGPAVLAAFLSVALFDFFFVPPHYTLRISDLQYLLTFAVLLLVALTTATLAAGLRQERDAAQEREQHTRALYEMARELSAALTTEQIAEIARRFVAEGFGAQATLLLPDAEGRPVALGTAPEEAARLQAEACRLALPVSMDGGSGGALAVAKDLLFLPLLAPMCARGLLALRPARAQWQARPDQLRLLETSATLVAIALERVHYVDVAQQAALDVRAERLRNTLLATLSHDLRTPLTALVGLAEALTLGGPPLPAQQAELARALHEDALRITMLVNKLLEMARLRSGRIALRREWLPPEEVAGAALRASVRLLAAHRIATDLPQDLPLVEVDPVLMERVLCNLLENAAKYSPPGSRITLSARVRGATLEFVVADEGPGLPAGAESVLFAKFVRGPAGSEVSGVGLGLSIVQTIVEAHGGSVSAENVGGGGARFACRLPLGEAPALPEEDA